MEPSDHASVESIPFLAMARPTWKGASLAVSRSLRQAAPFALLHKAPAAVRRLAPAYRKINGTAFSTL